MRIILPIASIAVFVFSIGAANADLIITPHTNDSGAPLTDTWKDESGQSVPTGTAGFLGGTLIAETAGLYTFTYGPPPPIGVPGGTGHGNSSNFNEFMFLTNNPNVLLVSGTGKFCTQNSCTDGTNASTVGATFTIDVKTANTALPFAFLYDQTGSTPVGPHTLNNGGLDNANGAYLAQLVGGACTSLTTACDSPSAPNALLGLSDNPYPADSDFQDLTVLVTEQPVPEPASLALLGSALVGFGVFRRRRKVSR